jgi:GTPase-associated protein 1, N-terminal domain type 2
MRIEQAIFTSLQSSRLDGYQLAATSSGIAREQEKELTVWGPAHDSLWDTRCDARSVNFHPLSDGTFCLSCTTIAGSEYSGRGGGRIYTQMFVLGSDALAQFANDPFLVLRALAAAGRLLVLDKIPSSLPSVPLLGRSTKADETLANGIFEEVGERVFNDLAQAIAGPGRVAVSTSGQVERLFQAVLHTLTFEQRHSISFTTGLKDSARRPFKLFVLPSDPVIVRQAQRASAVKVIDLVGESHTEVATCH